MLQKRVGMRIREMREKCKMTQPQLAEKLHVTSSSVKSWETGRTYPSIDNCVALSELFHVSTDYFFLSKCTRMMNLDYLTDQEFQMVLNMLAFFDENRHARPVYGKTGEGSVSEEKKENRAEE